MRLNVRSGRRQITGKQNWTIQNLGELMSSKASHDAFVWISAAANGSEMMSRNPK
jgi:hypothetical protein